MRNSDAIKQGAQSIWLRFTLGVLLAALLAGLTFIYCNARFARDSIAVETSKAANELELHATIARSYFAEFRALPSLLAQANRVRGFLKKDLTREEVETMLRVFALKTGINEIYLYDASGQEVARSGNIGALMHQPATQLFERAALGNLSRAIVRNDESFAQYGYGVRVDGAFLGVVIVEFGLDLIEADIRNSVYDIAIYDARSNPVIDFDDPLHQEALKMQLQTEPYAVNPKRVWLSQSLNAEPYGLFLVFETDEARARAARTALIFSALAFLAAFSLYLVMLQVFTWRQRYQERKNESERLERLVAERTFALEASLEDLKQTQSELVQAGKMAALGQMSAQLSHEFNQPLAAMRAYTENAIALIQQSKTALAESNMQRVVTLTERMAKLSQHLTRFSRRAKTTTVPVNICNVVNETLELMAGRIDRADASVKNELDAGLSVMGGEVRFQHVFLNLISNAIDATPSDRTPKIWIWAEDVGGKIEIYIKDNGAGIANAQQAVVFDPFYTTKDVGAGLGLGLSITYNILQDFGGSIRIVSSDENGTVFAVEVLPAP